MRDRELEDARHRRDGARLLEGGVEEERIDEIGRLERRLAHESPKRRGYAQAARTEGRKAHGMSLGIARARGPQGGDAVGSGAALYASERSSATVRTVRARAIH